MNILPNIDNTPLVPLKVAYFSMEVMLENDIATYAGGLGMLAGDILRSLADMEVPSVGVSMAFNYGYTNQVIHNDGSQNFIPAHWSKSDQLARESNTIELNIEGRNIIVECYRYDIVGRTGFIVPVFLLTTDHYENSEDQKYLTKYLYDYDNRIRMSQEVILGIGGLKMLRSLGYENIENFHMNDGHTAFLTLELLREQNYDMEKVKSMTCFTTHTPVPAGRDKFDYELTYKVLPNYLPLNIKELAGSEILDMPQLAWSLAKYVNGVSKKHGEVSTDMFKAPIDYITNGVHATTWLSPVTQEVLDQNIPGWQFDMNKFLEIDKVSDDVIQNMHHMNKQRLVDFVNEYLDKKDDFGSRFDTEKLTLTFARRCVPYKRPDLILQDVERLLRIGIGKIQIIFCGKAHPSDVEAGEILKRILDYRNRYANVMSIAYLENYSPSIAKYLVAGSDIWLNNPVVPMEASGTSGMKAAMNGTINFSILDGWVIEGVEQQPNSSFTIGELLQELYPARDDWNDADHLYTTLENEIIPMYYDHKDEWVKKMKDSIKLGASFNTDRVVREYLDKAWK